MVIPPYRTIVLLDYCILHGEMYGNKLSWNGRVINQKEHSTPQPQRREMEHFVGNGGAASGEDGRLSSQPSSQSQQRSTAKQARCNCKRNNFTDFTPEESIHSVHVLD